MTGEAEPIPDGWASDVARRYEASTKMNLETVVLSLAVIIYSGAAAWWLDNPLMLGFGFALLCWMASALVQMRYTVKALREVIDLMEDIAEQDKRRIGERMGKELTTVWRLR